MTAPNSSDGSGGLHFKASYRFKKKKKVCNLYCEKRVRGEFIVKQGKEHFNGVKVVLTTQNLNKSQNRNFLKVKMNNVEVRLQLDTGCGITIINENKT